MVKMASSWIFLAIAIFTLASAEQCPRTKDIDAKQGQLLDIIKYVNRPYHQLPQRDQNLSPDEEKKYRSHWGILEQREVYSVFDERYIEEANASLHFLLEPDSYDQFIRRAEILRHYINEDMFLYVLNVAVTHRDDTRGIVLPRIHDVYPDKFLTTDVIVQIKEAVLRGEKNIVVDDTAHDYDYRNPYSRLNYFLNDLALNSHHYHWHVQNSLLLGNRVIPSGPDTSKDRTGEAFYWMHHQMVNRFDAELLSNHLPRTTPFENWDDPIEEGYAPHLTVDRYQYRYMFRPANLVLRDLPEMTRNQMRQWRDRLLNAIHRGYVISSSGANVTLRDENGIDILSHLVEPNVDSVNPNLYGGLHSYAHVIAARVADADHKYGEDYGAMYDVVTSARDPLFYRWHKYVDDVFQEYKDSLDPYTEEERNWNDVKVEEVTVEGSKVNKIKTHLEEDIVHVGSGFSYSGDSSAKIKVRHLAHEDFKYNIQVTNNAGSAKRAIIRIYLAPKYDEQGEQIEFNEQCRTVIELDKFAAELAPGKNTITRQSSESSVIQDHKNVYADPSSRQDDDSCHCGWPDYLLIPRGSSEGTEFQLYVVVSDYQKDGIDVDQSCHCGDGHSYCSVLYGQNPDRRPHGYPFDRHTEARTFEQFRTPNMYQTDISIRYDNTVVKGSS